MSNAPTLNGTCGCGRITYTATASPQHLDYCYCLTCQRLSGAPFVPWLGIAKENVSWHGEKPFVFRAPVYDTDTFISERFICSHCGTNLAMWYYLYPNKIHVAAGTVTRTDFPFPKEVEMHLFVRHAPSWHTIPEDGVRRFQEFDPVFEENLRKFLEEGKKS